MPRNKSEFLNNIKDCIDIQRYEGERISRIMIMVVTEVLLFLLIIGGVYFVGYCFELDSKGVWYANGLSVFTGFALLLLVVFFFMNPGLSNKDFKNELKERCQNDIRKFFGLSMSTRHQLNRVELEDSNLFSSFNTLEYDDVLKGEYKGVSFVVEELELRDINGSGRNRTDFLAFKGVVISFPFNKNIKSQTLITTRGDKDIRNYKSGFRFLTFIYIVLILIPLCVLMFVMSSLLYEEILNYGFIDFGLIITSISSMLVPVCILGCFLWIFFKKHLDKKRQMDNVKTEDVSFDKRFCVYSKDQVESRYLVTPSFMERMKNLETAFGTKKIKCSFYEDRLLFAMSTDKDLFELGSLYSPSLMKHVNDFYNQVNSIYDIIDHFKLYENTGL